MDIKEVVEMATLFLEGRYKGEAIDYEGNPVVFAVAANNEMLAMPTFWRNQEEKYDTMRTLRLIFAAKNVTSYALVCEGWMATVDMKLNPELAKVMPMDRSDRVEVASVYAADLDGNVTVKQYLINRDGDSPTITPHDVMGDANAENIGGLFINLLQELPPMPEDVRQHIVETVGRHEIHRPVKH